MRNAIDPQKVYGHLKNKVQWALCDKCGWHWPETRLHLRGDGRKICPNHTDQRESSAMRTVRIQKDAARLARKREPIPKWPHAPEMRDVSGVTNIVPDVTQLTIGGANKVVELEGRNLSADDVFTFSASVELVAEAFTAIDAETRGNTATLTVRAPIGAVPGTYNLEVNGDLFRNVFEVRL